ncbi:AsnC family transcriptional regulator [Candidatus Pacearchaeota archaeon]|nr:AsnC family transcriptional regulator [Candidatus Pacearchaeota archaeon]MBD3282782.1 AsnC family transcriptional regulator [Candidatus Pacearchaeota archaeon]
MPHKTTLKSRVLDEKDKKILMILQDNGREQLESIASKVGLSIDSVHKRIKEMQRKNIFVSGIFIEPRTIGFPLIADVKIKLRNITEHEKKNFIQHLVEHPRIIELLSIMGDHDLTCVIIARDTSELEEVSTAIRQEYSGMIADWKSVLVLKTHKFEYYNLT